MKIGILTFHWATNYGAILQTYALQTYLINLGHDVHIINYRPKQYKKTFLGCFLKRQFWLILSNLKEYFKEKKLENFRREYLFETFVFKSLEELRRNSPDYDVYICGSDQVWNPYFTTKGEGRPTATYFLDFGNKNVKRIAYAISFGCEVYPDEASIFARKYIPSFDAISVREDSGIDIVKKMGFENPVKLPDPTFLLQKEKYLFPNKMRIRARREKAFIYILRNEYKQIKSIISVLKQKFITISANNFFNPISVEDWVYNIRSASFVLTNSFHGMVLSLVFHKPFIVVSAKGIDAGMNDRFNTILSPLNLDHRMISNLDSETLSTLLQERIQWDKIDSKLSDIKNESYNFFTKYLI